MNQLHVSIYNVVALMYFWHVGADVVELFLV